MRTLVDLMDEVEVLSEAIYAVDELRAGYNNDVMTEASFAASVAFLNPSAPGASELIERYSVVSEALALLTTSKARLEAELEDVFREAEKLGGEGPGDSIVRDMRFTARMYKYNRRKVKMS